MKQNRQNAGRTAFCSPKKMKLCIMTWFKFNKPFHIETYCVNWVICMRFNVPINNIPVMCCMNDSLLPGSLTSVVSWNIYLTEGNNIAAIGFDS